MKTFFSTSIHQGPLKLKKSVKDAIAVTALKLPELDAAGVKWSKKNYGKGYTSYSSMTMLHEQFSMFGDLKRALDQEVKKYAHALKLKFNPGALELSAIWVNVMPENCYHAFHAHPLSVISGTYYAVVPRGASPLRIEDPRASLFMATPPRKIQVDLLPKAGDIILFESWLRHEVPPHEGNELRVSVSFNYDWVGR